MGSRGRKKEYFRTEGFPVGQLLHLQQTIGNQVVQRLFKYGEIQAKLRIGKLNDIYEQGADRVAEQVMRMPELQQANDKGESAKVKMNITMQIQLKV